MRVGTNEAVWLITATPAVSVDVASTLRAAASVLRDQDIGAVAVVGSLGVAGLLSERDIVRAVADGADPAATPVSSLMAEHPLVVEPETLIGSVAELMLTTGVRHLPVVEGDALLGMVSMRDVLDVARSQATTAG